MRPLCTVGDWSLPLLLDRTIAERFAIRVLAEPHGSWFAVEKTDHGVFPIARQVWGQ